MDKKIIHIDMDCFYAAIEIRDNPSLADKPVAVGGEADKRGVICTCNYIARSYGIHSAMATATAYRYCPNLILLPVNMPKYKEVAKNIHKIFYKFTELVEPLALDEAYLDVTNSEHHQGSATLIAKEIRQIIWQQEKLIASAGVAPNKFLSKIASGWKKPNCLFVIPPDAIQDFIHDLPVDALYGVGKVTAKKLHNLNLKACADIQKHSLPQLTSLFGKFGQQLYNQARGIDHRNVEPHRERKSLSVEQTLIEDVNDADICIRIICELFEKLQIRIQESASHLSIKNAYLKLKLSDFKLMTSENAVREINLLTYTELFHALFARDKKSVRLIGLGVHFHFNQKPNFPSQHLLFD